MSEINANFGDAASWLSAAWRELQQSLVLGVQMALQQNLLRLEGVLEKLPLQARLVSFDAQLTAEAEALTEEGVFTWGKKAPLRQLLQVVSNLAELLVFEICGTKRIESIQAVKASQPDGSPAVTSPADFGDAGVGAVEDSEDVVFDSDSSSAESIAEDVEPLSLPNRTLEL